MIRCLLYFGVVFTLTCFYIYGDDRIHHYTNQFVVWCDNESKDDIIAEWALSEKFRVEKLNISDQDCLYLVTDMSKPKGTRSLQQDTNTVKRLMAPKKVNKVEQQEYKVRVKKTADTKWSNLWYLNGALAPSMKIQEAWNLGYNGSGVVIAVVDDGVEITHSDLVANMYSGYHYDYVDNDANPDPADGNDHGTKCSGLIAAEANNNKCVAGVAYSAKVIGVRLLTSNAATDLMESRSLSHQHSIVDIYSNSWGPDDGSGYSDIGNLAKEALLSGITSGRSGKGSIYTWAAGNGGMDDNCNADGYVNSIYTIGVTSLDSTGIPAYYSEVCAAVMATTYGGTNTSFLYSTANSGNCANDLEGTSFATPVASGIIALSLQANPNLNWRDVQHLIVLTSKQYTLTDIYYSWQLNGAKKYVHPRLGFGLMDAEDMVKYASKWTQVPDPISFQSSTSSPNSYAGASGVYNSITIGSDCSIQYLEHVQVQLSFQADGVGFVELTLTSPSGTKSFLMTQRKGDNNNPGSDFWTFMTVQHWGEAPQGQWTLKMVVAALSGRLYSWKLILYGTQTDPLPNINVCAGSPCASGETCTGNNYGYECIKVTSATTSTTASTTTSATAAITGGVATSTIATNISTTAASTGGVTATTASTNTSTTAAITGGVAPITASTNTSTNAAITGGVAASTVSSNTSTTAAITGGVTANTVSTNTSSTAAITETMAATTVSTNTSTTVETTEGVASNTTSTKTSITALLTKLILIFFIITNNKSF
ncbi:hypothetical protein ACJMK2_007848 [Sinanodonta woodiana]|uniref:P/Homo B domain-containing protein n=1 Tax=Sinanodonta woodiana TaxID=1069815 RepID=A0ABD3VJR1_SINWO